MKLDNLSSQVYVVAVNEARLHGHEYLTPEHFLYSALMFDDGKEIIKQSGGDLDGISLELSSFFNEQIPKKATGNPMESYSFNQMVNLTSILARNEGRSQMTIIDFISAMLNLKESYASYILQNNGVEKSEINKSEKKPIPIDEAKKVVEKDETVSAFTVDLVELAKDEKLDPLVGREDIIDRTINVLCRRLKNNPVHVGDPGVGKTAIVEGFAQKIAAGEVPDSLKNAVVLRLDMGALVAGTKYRGEFEERLVKLLNAVKKYENPIIYIDEIHTVVGTGAISGGAMDATSIIKPYLSGGDIKFIGSTTFEEYKKHFEKDRALVRRFARIDVLEPTQDECVKILQGLRSHYENFHSVKYTDEILTQIINLSDKHMNDRFLPDKAIDIMDEVGVYARLSKENITSAMVEKIVASAAKVPEKNVSANEYIKLKSLKSNLKKTIFGQEEAIEKVIHAIHSSRAGLNDEFKPVASFLFVGPTGVGKTELSSQLANILGISLTRFDMSEYQEKHAVARLIGAPPGYVGYEEGGLLTDAVRKTPHSVLLLDEIEKAHADILNVLLQVLDYGNLTDNTGKKADFRNTIIIMTSNAGARESLRNTIGFDSSLDLKAADTAVNNIFSPEFRNRLDDIIRFNPLDKKMSRKIAKKALDKLAMKLAAKGVVLTSSNKALDFIAAKGFSEIYGAREIIRLVENDVKKLLTEEVLFGKLKKGGECKLLLENGVFKLDTCIK